MRGYYRGMIVVLAVAVVLRGMALARGPGALEDPDNYLLLARSLAEGHGFALNGRPTAYRPPLYPLLLAPLVATLGPRLGWGVAALHLALGAGTVALTATAARRWGLSPRLALAAAALVAADPVLVAQARAVMTETLAAFLIAATLAVLTIRGPRGALLGGFGFGLAALCRPSLLPVAGLAALGALACGPGPTRDRWRRSVLIVGATAATLAPWAWRNTRAVGAPVWTTTHGGYTLALANNPVYFQDVHNGPPDAVWSGPNQARWFESVNHELAGLSEPEADRRLRASAVRWMAARPRDFARAAVARLGRFWAFAPSKAVYPFWLRVATALWSVPIGLAVLAGLTRRDLWRWPRLAAPAVLIALSCVHVFYWTDLRMRAPAVPALALIAVGALARRSPLGSGGDVVEK